MRESHYITPTRLSKNEHLWKTIDVLKIVNPEFTIHLPRSTQDWLIYEDNWDKISTGNAAMCLGYFERAPYQYRWTTNIEAAKKVLNFILENKLKRSYSSALNNSYIEEEAINNFIETDLFGSEKTTNYLSDLLGNSTLKRYQYERIWDKIPEEQKRNYISPMVRYPLYNIPDYIFVHFVKQFLSLDNFTYFPSSFLAEGIKRGMITQVSVPTVVASQSRPTKILAVQEILNGKENQENKETAGSSTS